MNTRMMSFLLLVAGCSDGVIDASQQASRAEDRYRRSEPQLLASGKFHSCVVRSDGDVYCWGVNSNGQLGTGSASSYSGPVLASQLTKPMVQITVGDAHTCGLTSDGEVQCWGSDEYGQIGNSATTGNAYAPYRVLTNAVDLASGSWHTCALLADGAVKCWGRNASKQLGNAQTYDRTSPITASLLTQTNGELIRDFVDLSAGDTHTCGVRSDGTSLCWGGYSSGQVGVAGAIMPIYTGAMEGVDVAAIAAGGYHTCAVATDGTVWCVGANNFGQLGIGSIDTSSHRYPSQVQKSSGTALTNVVAVASGAKHNCALVKTGQLYCWGDGSYRELGSTSSSATRATLVSGITDAIAVEAGGDYTCYTRAAGSHHCFGRNDVAQLGYGNTSGPNAGGTSVALGTDHGVLDLDVGTWHTCQRNADGTVDCWGLNMEGEVGDGTTDQRTTPTQVLNLPNAVAITTGMLHSCAILSDHTVKCWGSNWFSAIGDGSTVSERTSPSAVQNLSDAISIDAGLGHTCVVTMTGQVKCWGTDRSGQLGSGPGEPIGYVYTVAGLSGALAVSAGGEHTCVLHIGGISCFGDNSKGQVGVSDTSDQISPVAVANLLGDESAISAGNTHTCALTSKGQVECWGRGDSGQLGDGSYFFAGGYSSSPRTATLDDAVAISAGGNHSCAITANGSLYCWGSNSVGQLGLTGGNRNIPTLVPVGQKVIAVAATDDRTCVLTDINTVICYGS
jgi:alpha-tubulin suppressor-like RCC1 family protein